jgi:hypothetical protein
MLLTFIKRVFGIKTVDTTPAAPYKIEPPVVTENAEVIVAPSVVKKLAELDIDADEVKSEVAKAKKPSVKKTAAKKAPSEKKPATKRAKKTTE